MAWTPPTKFIVILSFIIALAGLILGSMGALLMLDDFPALFEDLGPNGNAIFIGVLLCFFSWVLMFLGVKLKGL